MTATLNLYNPDGKLYYQRFVERVTAPETLERKRHDWTFAKACAFWKLDTRWCGARIDRQLRAFARKLRRMEHWRHPHAAAVEELSAMLMDRYAQHLELLRKRKESRP